MFGMLMRSLPLSYFARFLETQPHLFSNAIPSTLSMSLLSLRRSIDVSFEKRTIVARYVTCTKSIDLLGIGDPRATRCSHYSCTLARLLLHGLSL